MTKVVYIVILLLLISIGDSMDQATREAVSVSVEQAMRPLIAPALALLKSQGTQGESLYTNRPRVLVTQYKGVQMMLSSGTDGEELTFRHVATGEILKLGWSSSEYSGDFRLLSHALLIFEEQAPWFVEIKKVLAD